ncbi:MAG: murI [Clostridiales bacterium]|jgi:glutamate racemase|nr:murI [Clostridiales bacterium]
MDKPIGVFDSGVGGLTVAKEIMKLLPNEKVVYFGDTARVPYGSKSKETVVRYARQIIRFLLTKDVKAIVIACNTACALALDTVKDEFDIPIIGVVKPGVEMALRVTKNKSIGIIGTEGTIKSETYTKLIHKVDSGIQVTGKACPLFVPLVEEGLLKDSITREVASRYLSVLKEQNIDSLVLGCTHYPLITNILQEVMGDKVTLVNPAIETAKELSQLLDEKGIKSLKLNELGHEFFVSDREEKFEEFAKLILKYKMMPVSHVNIEDY